MKRPFPQMQKRIEKIVTLWAAAMTIAAACLPSPVKPLALAEAGTRRLPVAAASPLDPEPCILQKELRGVSSIDVSY